MVGDDTASSDVPRNARLEPGGEFDVSDAELAALIEESRDDRGPLTATDDSDFTNFYRSDITQLVGFIMKAGAALHQAEDIAQRAMMSLYAHWEIVEHPKAWVRKVAIRLFLRSSPADRYEAPTHELPDQPASPLLSPEARAIVLAESQTVRLLLAVLPQQQRLVIAYRMEETYTDADIAKALGTTPKAVRAAAKRARSVLKEQAAQLQNGGT